MTRLRGPWTATAAVTLFLLSACANGSDPGGMIPSYGSASGSAVPTSPDQLVLRVRRSGGLVGNRGQFGAIAPVSIYGDGRVVTPAPVPAIYPGPAMTNLQVQLVSPATLTQLLATGDALLAKGGDVGRSPVQDGTTTTITIKGKSISVYALSEAQPSDPSLSPAQQRRRAELAAFAEQISDLPSALGMATAQPYEPVAVAILASPFVKPADGLPSQPAAAPWPGPALPGAYLNKGVKQGCVIASGDTLRKMLPVAQKAMQNAAWTSGGATWTVKFRPLLPEETGCADLQEPR
jgi:hypothetical protein